MAERKSSGQARGSSKSGGSKGSGGRRSPTKKSGSRAKSTRTPTAYEKKPPSQRSPIGDDDDGGDMSKSEEAQTGGKPMGRPPGDEPDVYVYVPKVHVGELCIDVERLEAHLALRAQVANLVNLVAGVHVAVDKVKIDLKDVDAEAELKVRLENTYNILDRTLTTLDENPEVVQGLLETADTAVQETGQIGQDATKPGGAVSELSSGVGDSLSSLTDGLGNTLSNVADKGNPKKLLRGSGSRSGKANRSAAASSNGSRVGKAAVAAGAGAAGLAGATLIGRRKDGIFHRRSTFERVLDELVPQFGKGR